MRLGVNLATKGLVVNMTPKGGLVAKFDEVRRHIDACNNAENKEDRSGWKSRSPIKPWHWDQECLPDGPTRSKVAV